MAMNKEEVDMDNPAYAQQSPYLRVEEDEEQEIPAFMRGGNPRRPVVFDALLNNVRAITKKLEHIKGFKFEVSGGLSNNLHLTHSWMIPHGGPVRGAPQNPMKPPQVATYTLGAQFVGGEIRRPTDQPKIIMTGRWDSTGKLEAAMIKKINEMFSLRFNAYYMNSDPLNAQIHLDLDISGEDYVHTVKFGTGLWSFNMMQTIGNKVALGFEFMNLTERNQMLMSYALKYNHSRKQTFYAQYVGHINQLILAYNHRVFIKILLKFYLIQLLQRAFFVSELQFNQQNGQTKAILGFRQRFATSEVIATLNSNFKLSTVLNLQGLAYQLKLCAIADYKKDTYKFGYGIGLGQM